MIKFKKVILIPPNISFGDTFSVNGLMHFLLDYYEELYLYIGPTHIIGYTVPQKTIHDVIEYTKIHFKHEPLFNNRIKITNSVETLIGEGEYGEYHICNTLTGDWSGPNRIFIDLPNVNKEYYFNDENPIYNKLTIPEEFICSPNKHLPSITLSVNHLLFYELIGLNNNVRMNFFNYVRNKENELEYKETILKNHGITDGNYNIINDPEHFSPMIEPHINNDYPNININYLSDNPCSLLTLLEDAKSIHFIEGSNVNFFYHAQYKNIFNYNGVINFHIWLRNRNWPSDRMNLDYAWTMMNTPKLDNWKFIFDPNQI